MRCGLAGRATDGYEHRRQRAGAVARGYALSRACGRPSGGSAVYASSCSAARRVIGGWMVTWSLRLEEAARGVDGLR
jgi:hypothetical protein